MTPDLILEEEEDEEEEEEEEFYCRLCKSLTSHHTVSGHHRPASETPFLNRCSPTFVYGWLSHLLR